LEIGDVVFKFNLIEGRFVGELLGEGAVRIFVGGRSINITAVGAIIFSCATATAAAVLLIAAQEETNSSQLNRYAIICSRSSFLYL
jgi:hypothetical protein